MNGISESEVSPKLPGQRLTLRRARMALIRQLCSALLLSASGLYLLFHGNKFLAGSFCLGAMLSAASVPAFWKQYRMVKEGAIVTIQPEVSSQLIRVHPAASIVATSLMTLMVLIMGAGTLYTLPLMVGAGAFKVFLVFFNLFLWLITGFLWYRILTERRKTAVVEPVYEQGEGVWPPAPQIPKSE